MSYWLYEEMRRIDKGREERWRQADRRRERTERKAGCLTLEEARSAVRSTDTPHRFRLTTAAREEAAALWQRLSE